MYFIQGLVTVNHVVCFIFIYQRLQNEYISML